MSKFHLFAWTEHEANGGLRDWQGGFSSQQQAEAQLFDPALRANTAQIAVFDGDGNPIISNYVCIREAIPFHSVPARWVRILPTGVQLAVYDPVAP